MPTCPTMEFPPFAGTPTLNENGKHLLRKVKFHPQSRFLNLVFRSAFWLEPLPRCLLLSMLLPCLLIDYSATLSNFLIFLKHILPLSVRKFYDLVKHTSVILKSSIQPTRRKAASSGHCNGNFYCFTLPLIYLVVLN